MNRFAMGFAALTVVALGTAPAARAARLIHWQVELDGQIVLEGIATDSGHEPAEFVWLYLHSTVWEPSGGFTMPEAAGHPPQSKIEGRIMLRAQHVDRVLAEATLDSLAFRPYPSQSWGWQIMPDEVTRTAKLAGLTIPQGEAMTGPGFVLGALLEQPIVLLAVVVAGLTVILIVLGVWWGVRRRNPGSE